VERISKLRAHDLVGEQDFGNYFHLISCL